MSSESVKLDHYCYINPEVITKKYPFQLIRYYDISSVNTGFLNEPPKRYFLTESPSRAKRILRSGDIIISTVRPNRRSFLYLKAVEEGDIASTGFAILRAKQNVDSRFIYYLISEQKFTDYLVSHATGSAYPAVSPESIMNAPVPLLNYAKQKTIADILSSLDDKIKLNRQMCQTLENIANTLFKSWFIDFDTVKAKAAGCEPEGLSPEITELFPNTFNSNEIPCGWHFSVAYDWAEYINGAAYKDSHFTEAINGLPIIKIAELKSGISSGTKYSNVNLGDKYKIDTGNILLSWSGSPETSIDTFLWVGGAAWLNQHIFNVIPKAPESRTFVYFLLKYLKPLFINIAKNKQTTGLGHITVKDLKELKVINPGSKLISSFDMIVAPILQRIQQSMEENIYLTRIRKNLLSKLISGEIQL